jgi:predicted aspartyl protease
VLPAILFKPAQPSRVIEIDLVIDSGADITLIPETELAKLGARPVSRETVIDFNQEEWPARVYEVGIKILELDFPYVRVIGLGRDRAIMGRDLLNGLVVTLNGPGRLARVSK